MIRFRFLMLIFAFTFTSSFSRSMPLKKVFGVGQPEYHRLIYKKTWNWLKEKEKLIPTSQDEKIFSHLIDDCIQQVNSFSETIGPEIEINYLRVLFLEKDTEVQLFCPDSILKNKKANYTNWFKNKLWTGNFWIWNFSNKKIKNFEIIHQVPKQVDLSILGSVQNGYKLAPLFLQDNKNDRIVFLNPIPAKQTFQVHPFADPERFIILNEIRKTLEFSTKILVIENHPNSIKSLTTQFIDEFGIIPDRMISTKNSFGLVLP